MVDNTLPSSIAEKLLAAVKPERLLKTATALVEVPSPTRSAGAAADRLAAILREDGFRVERPEADWAESPAVVTRLDSGKPGRTLQFDGHLDTVHLPFAPPRFEQGVLHGSGASDMKGGIAAFVEALRVLQETGALTGGGILLTAHDHHEGPWGDGRQLRALIDAGYTGDGVLLPEYLGDRLALAGRGSGIFEITISRQEPPVHEVLRPQGLPDVLGTGVELAGRFARWQQELEQQRDPYAGHDSVFVGKFQSGEIYNQSPPGMPPQRHPPLGDSGRGPSGGGRVSPAIAGSGPGEPDPNLGRLPLHGRGLSHRSRRAPGLRASVGAHGCHRKTPAAWRQAFCGRRQRLLQPGRNSRLDPRPPGPGRPHHQRDGHAGRTGPGGPGLRPDRGCLLLGVSGKSHGERSPGALAPDRLVQRKNSRWETTRPWLAFAS